MYPDESLLPLSALQHLIFCERQCALIHIERLWSENWFTAQGRVLHERVHEQKTERRRSVRVEHGVDLRSSRLGLIGKADIVEFHRDESGKVWRPFPVEFKRGRNKPDNSDKVQLCAQAVCLEEMLSVEIPLGEIYYGKERHRTEVVFDEALREETFETARRLHKLIETGRTPPPVYEKKCDSCSLKELCMPQTIQKKRSVTRYLEQVTGE